MKIYLAGGISDLPRKNYQKYLAKEIEKLGYRVYAAARNNSINDKTKDPTPQDIYQADVSEIISSDIFVATISGGNEDGTISEIGLVSGLNEVREKPIPIIAFTTNERLVHPQFWNGIASGGMNHLLAGMIDKWGSFAKSEQELLEMLKTLRHIDIM